uniref:Large conductance mechanosensitive channel protein n=1 Tax=viral metagenome TaxID=1070528 RepID=A0A6C0EIR7_9ZZZZ
MSSMEIINNTEKMVGEGVGSFYKVLKDFNVIGFVLGLLIANSVAEIANSFIDGIIMPSIKPLLDRIKSNNTNIKVGGLNLHLDKFLNSLLKFLVLAFIIFILLQLGINMTRPLTWVRIEQIKDGLKL